MNELQYLKDLKKDIEAKIAEIESNQAAVKWEPKGGDYYADANGLVYAMQSTVKKREFGSERETQEQAEHAAEWMRKFNRLMCWFEENAPEHEPGHEIDITFDEYSASIIFSANKEVIDDLRTKISDGVVEL